MEDKLLSVFLDWSKEENTLNKNKIISQARGILSNKKFYSKKIIDKFNSEEDGFHLFIAYALSKGNQMPSMLLKPMLVKAYYAGPGLRKYFIQPCVRSFNQSQINTSLESIFNDIDNKECLIRDRIDNMFYWINNAYSSKQLSETREKWTKLSLIKNN